MERQNGYVISDQGKPPEFILEVGLPSTRREDTGRKREFYARLGVLEYWRFDEEDSPHVVKLAGDRLLDGSYTPIPVTGLADGSLEGHSEIFNLVLRWEQAQLLWYDPVNRRYVLTAEDYAERARDNAERANIAELSVQELEAQLREDCIAPA